MPLIPLKPLRISLLVSSLFLASCQAVISESGNIIDPTKVEQIHIGTTTRDEILKLLGPPTLTNTFRQERWIYIQDRQFRNIQRTFSRVTNRLEITFDSGGVVQDIQRNFEDSLYDPRTANEGNKDEGYTQWLFGGEFAKPNNNPKPTQESPVTESPTEKSTEKSKDATHSSWSIWPWNKSDETTEPQPKPEAETEAPAIPDTSSPDPDYVSLPDLPDVDDSHTRLKAPALLEQLNSMEVKPPDETLSDTPTPKDETPSKPTETTEPSKLTDTAKPSEPSSTKPPWWQFWSK
ncbi:MAG: outer membrane protein assembly factor BamE [Nitrospirae bacterium]|nr:outer membrane protein assembly factor BamE [Magnetococcales bacterium]